MNSNIAKGVRLDTRLVIHDDTLSQLDLARIAANGAYGPLTRPGIDCRFVCGGQVVALGKLVTQKGKTVFQIEKTEQEEEHGTR